MESHMKILKLHIVLMVALLVAASAFASPPADQASEGKAITVSQVDSVEINGYTQGVYCDQTIACPTLRYEFRGRFSDRGTVRTRQTGNFERYRSFYTGRAIKPDKPPNELFASVANNRAREKV